MLAIIILLLFCASILLTYREASEHEKAWVKSRIKFFTGMLAVFFVCNMDEYG